MNLRFLLPFLITLAVIVGCLYFPFVPQTTLPFEVRPAGDGYAVAHSSTGMPMPAGLQAGDRLDIWHAELKTRLIFTTNVGNPPAGTTFDITVTRDGKELTLPVALVTDHKTGENLLVFLLYVGLTWLYAALGLLLLWRGQRPAAAAVCLWCLLSAVSNVLGNLSLSFYLGAILAEVSNDLAIVGTLVALYVLADDLAQDGIGVVARSRLRWAFLLCFGLYCMGLVATKIYTIFYGAPQGYFRMLVSVHLVAFAIPLALLALCYRPAPIGDRARIRWVAASMLLGVAAYLVTAFGGNYLDGLQQSLIITTLSALSFIGLTYTVLRHRLVSLRLVLNRALVYGVITSLVVGIFASLSSLIQHLAIGGTESALLQLLVPLTLGVTLNLVKKRLDTFVERFFFQRQYQAEAALARFARECGFIENLDILLERTCMEVQADLRSTGVALYESTPAGYRRLREHGEQAFPETLAVDDPAMVSLRASLAEAELEGLKSALGKEGLVFPLAVRGVLSGALVIGQRPAEQYTTKEHTLVSQLTAQVAAAMHALRTREAEAFVAAVARGAMPAPSETRSRALELLSLQLNPG